MKVWPGAPSAEKELLTWLYVWLCFILDVVLGVFFLSRLASWERFEPPHDKTNKMACAPSEDSDQPGHPPFCKFCHEAAHL